MLHEECSAFDVGALMLGIGTPSARWRAGGLDTEGEVGRLHSLYHRSTSVRTGRCTRLWCVANPVLPLCPVSQVTVETEELRFNTGIAAMMEFVNGATKSWGNRPRAALEVGAGE